MSTNAAPSDELTLEEVVRESSRPVVDDTPKDRNCIAA